MSKITFKNPKLSSEGFIRLFNLILYKNYLL